MARGRPPLGSKLVRNLEGSGHAKRRLELIIGTLTGEYTVVEASGSLGVSESAFFKLRTQALDGALKNLEPKPMGRPPKLATEEAKRIAELEVENDQLTVAVAASQVREELALAMPFLAERLKLNRDIEATAAELRGEKGRHRRRCGTRRADDRSVAVEVAADGAAEERPCPEQCPGPQGAQARRADEDRDGGEGNAER